jgi:hypothetical protein
VSPVSAEIPAITQAAGLGRGWTDLCFNLGLRHGSPSPCWVWRRESLSFPYWGPGFTTPQKDTQDNVSHKARFISSQLGSGCPPDAVGLNEDPEYKTQAAFIFFRHESRSHSNFYGPWGHILLASPTSWRGPAYLKTTYQELGKHQVSQLIDSPPFSKINQKPSP